MTLDLETYFAISTLLISVWVFAEGDVVALEGGSAVIRNLL